MVEPKGFSSFSPYCTVTTVEPLTEPAVAVIVDVPAATARASPRLLASLLIAITAGLEELQITDCRTGVLLSLKVPGLETDYETNQRRSLTTLRGRLFHLRAAFGAMKAVDVNEQKIERYKQGRLADKTRRGNKPIQAATVNRELSMLRKAFRLALRQKRIATLPVIDLLDGETVRHGFAEPGDFERLIIALPDHLKDFTRFAYITGWRIGEIRGLEWLKVNRDAQSIFLGYSKNGEPRILPLVGELEKMIDRRWEARTVETKDGSTILASYVFHKGNGTRIGDFRKAWATARAKAGLPGVLFHDLRRSAVRNLDRSGVSQVVGMMISGHKTASVYKRYRIVPENDIREALMKVQEAAERERKNTRVVTVRTTGKK